MSLSGKGLRKSLGHGSPLITYQEPQRKPNCGYLCATPLHSGGRRLMPKRNVSSASKGKKLLVSKRESTCLNKDGPSVTVHAFSSARWGGEEGEQLLFGNFLAKVVDFNHAVE